VKHGFHFLLRSNTPLLFFTKRALEAEAKVRVARTSVHAL